MTDVKYTPIVIIGGGLTGLSLAAGLDMRDIPFVLLEKKDRLGGQIRTLHKDGFTYEIGPNTGSVSTPEVAELFEYAAPEAQMAVAKSASNSRWIWKDKKFHPLPDGPISGLATPLFSWRDKFGIPFEPFRKKGGDPNETVGELAERRLGKSMVDYAVDPFIGGVYAGDPYQLVTRLALPKLYNLEQNHGSFIGGAVKKAKEHKSERDKKATKRIFNAEGGFENLVRAIANKIVRTGEVVTGADGIKITPTSEAEHRFSISYHHEGQDITINCDYVVSTVRADFIPSILPDEWAPCLERIASFPYAPVAEVVVGFDHLPSVPRAAFGGLVPSKEKRKILGILFPSSCFEGRVPYEDGALFTIFMGGLRNKEHFFEMSDEDLKKEALEELYTMMKIPHSIRPDLLHIARYEKAIPQYDKSVETILSDLQSIEDGYPGLYLAGGIRDGIGMAHRITQGMTLAESIAKELMQE
ncbi:protoporphyrinogen oxidase [Porphyromonadaceae bacterium W3.11]|nr:protoporphyrinogen oxidase [Porphyromonadaceae bacterium W3.11]